LEEQDTVGGGGGDNTVKRGVPEGINSGSGKSIPVQTGWNAQGKEGKNPQPGKPRL